MKIKTIRGALRAVQHKVTAGHKEAVTYSCELDKTYGLFATDRAWYIVCLLQPEDHVDFSRLFPELAKQLSWNQGIRLSRQGISAVIGATRRLPAHDVSSSVMIFVDENGRFLEIGPATLMGFCEYMGLVTGHTNGWYVFPTIILHPVFGSKRSPEELAALQRASLISQVNSVEADEDTRQQYFVDAVLQLGEAGIEASSDADSSVVIPAGSFDQFDFSGDGAVLSVLNEINHNLTRIRELLEKTPSQ